MFSYCRVLSKATRSKHIKSLIKYEKNACECEKVIMCSLEHIALEIYGMLLSGIDNELVSSNVSYHFYVAI